MYDSISKELCWPFMSSDVYGTVRECRFCAHKLVHGRKQWRLKLFLPYRPLECICMNTLGPLSKTEQGNQLVDVMSDRCKKLTKAILTSQTNGTTVVHIFVVLWVANFGNRSKIYRDKGTKICVNFSMAACSTLRVNNVTRTEFHLQKNDQAKRFSTTILSRLCNYVFRHQTDSEKRATTIVCVQSTGTQA